MIGRHHLNHGDVESLSTFLLRLYAATDLQDFRKALIQGLRQLVPADRCSINYIDPMTSEPAWVADGLDYPMNARIFAAHIREHPIPVHIRRTGEPGCLRLSDITTRQTFHQGRLYAEWYRGHLALLLSEQFVEMPAKMLELLGLTPREAEVLKWVAEGKRDGEIAVTLGLSSRTVSHHLERIYRKLSVETRTAAAARAREVVSLAATQ